MVAAKGKKSKTGLALVVLAVIAALVVVLIPRVLGQGSTAGYESASVSKGTVETFYTFTGSVNSKSTQSVMAENIMQISEIKVSEGDKVYKDDVLFIGADAAEVRAKIDGTVSNIKVEVDEQVMSGALLCEIYDFDNLQVSVKVDEYDLPSIQADATIEVSIPALEKEISGSVAHISDTAINQNGVAFFTAELNLEKDSAIKVGMTAEARILQEQAKDVLTIPVKALMFDDENNPYVYTKGDKNAMIKTTLTVGINDGKIAEITSGLRSGDTVYYTSENAKSSGGNFMPPMPGR